MIGIQRRKRVEGWAVDVTDTDATGGPSSLRQKLGEDNRLWLVFMGLIVIATFWILMNGKSDSVESGKLKAKSLPAFVGSYTDDKHTNLADFFLENKKKYSSAIVEAGYVADGDFRVVMSNGTSSDEIEYVAKMAAKLVEYKVGERAVVNMYLLDAPSGKTRPIAKTAWDDDKSNYKVIFNSRS